MKSQIIVTYSKCLSSYLTENDKCDKYLHDLIFSVYLFIIFFQFSCVRSSEYKFPAAFRVELSVLRKASINAGCDKNVRKECKLQNSLR